MTDFTISFTRSARKELSRLEKTTVNRIIAQIEKLIDDPHPPGCRKIQGASDLWRIRIGNYRVLYRIIDQELIIEVVAVRHRRDAYRF